MRNDYYIEVNKLTKKLLFNSRGDAFKLRNNIAYITNLYDVDPIIIYLLLLKGKDRGGISQLPNNYFTYQGKPTIEGRKKAIRITRYFIEKYLGYNIEQVYDNITCDVFFENKMSSIVRNLYNGSCVYTLMDAYPKSIKPWLFKKIRVPKNYWSRETAIIATRYIILKKLKWNRQTVCKRLTYDLLCEQGLAVPIREFFNYSPYKLIIACFPDKNYKPWELKTPNQFTWNQESSKKAIKWMLQKKLKWDVDKIRKYYNTKLCYRFHLSGLLTEFFDHSCFLALDNAYPNMFLPWEFKVPQNFFQDKDNIILFSNWISEQGFKIDEKKIQNFKYGGKHALVSYEVFEAAMKNYRLNSKISI